jgi:hypothetical protein
VEIDIGLGVAPRAGSPIGPALKTPHGNRLDQNIVRMKGAASGCAAINPFHAVSAAFRR